MSNIKDFLKFLKTSKTAFHACAEFENILNENGFIKLSESQKWELKRGNKYYLTRNNASLVAFTIPNDNILSYNITAAHLDSPTFKLKPNFKFDDQRYNKLSTEVYGGPIYNTWFDRPLDIAGRVMVEENGNIKPVLFSFDKPVCMIPNLPIHYNREVNNGVKISPTEITPIYGDRNISNANLLLDIAKKLNVKPEQILSYDLFLALIDRGQLLDDFIMAPQIDNLECSYGLIKALTEANGSKAINICALFDSEEIGSRTRDGAASTLLLDIIERISFSLGYNLEENKIALANSFIISADNAQGFNPIYPAKYDLLNPGYLNSGIVIKNAARGSYTTDAFSSAYFKQICKAANALYQDNTNRSDMPGGSTLGAISLANVSIPSVDIGLAQLAMHSAYETAGVKDLDYLIDAIKAFYSSNILSNMDGDLKYEIRR